MADNLKVAGLRLVIEGAAEFNSTISQINSKLQLSSAEFAKLQAQYGKNSNSVELLAGKQKLLQDKLQATKDIGQQYNRILEETVAKYGENSAEADKVRVAIAKNEAEQIKLEKQLEAVTQQLKIQSSAWTQVGQKAQEIGKKFSDVGEKMVKAGTKLVAVGGAVVGALGGVAVSASKSADEINTLSKQTGMSTDTLQKFAYASDIIDVDLNTLTKSYAKLTKQMNAARDGTGAAAEAFATLGVSVTDANGQLRDNEEVFAEVIAALGNIENETERDALAMTIFGKSAQELNPLILGGADALAEMGDEAEALGLVLSQDTLDSLNAFNDVIDSSKAKFKALKDVIGAKVVEAISPYFDDITAAIDRFVSKLAEVPSETIATIAAIAGVVAGIGSFLVIGGKIAGIIGSAISGFGALATAIGAASAGTGALAGVFTALSGPIGIVIAAVAALSAAFIALWQTDEDFRAGVEAGWEQVKEFFSELWSMIADIFSAAFELIKTIVQAALDNVKQFWEQHGEAIKLTVDTIWTAIKTIIETVLTLISGIIKTITAVIQGDWKGAWEIVKSTATTIWENIKTNIGNIFENIKTAIHNKLEEIKTKWTEAWENVKSTLQNAGEAIKSAISNLGTAIKAKFQEIIDNARNWGRNLIQGFVQGIREKIDAVRQAASEAVAAAKDFLGFNSPAKKGEGRHIIEWGANFVKGFIDGMRSMQAALANTAARLSSAAVGGMSASTTDNRSYSFGGITVQNMVVRDETDIKKIAQELYRLQVRNARGKGVVA